MTCLTKLYFGTMLLLCFLISNPVFASDQGGPRTRIPQMNWENPMETLQSTSCIPIPANNILEIELSIGMVPNDLENFPPLYMIVINGEIIPQG